MRHNLVLDRNAFVGSDLDLVELPMRMDKKKLGVPNTKHACERTTKESIVPGIFSRDSS